MRMLDRKLVRDLRRMWAQALAIALVMASGVATFVLASGAYQSLDETRAAYYQRYRFADVFAQVRRAPKSVMEQIAAIPGVAAAEPRISHLALIDVEDLVAPATARVISIPDLAEPRLNLLHLREGRLPERERTDEVAVTEGFAKAHRVGVGATFRVLLNGRKRELKVVGIALSPEFIYAVGPGDLMPDDRRFAILWMSEKGVAGLFDLDGAFNDVTLTLLPGASQAEVVARLDALLERYGGTGAYARKDQLSHAFLDSELTQLDAMRRVIPPIFLLVSAFLINITLSRMIALEREQIGLLKALGYGPLTIAAHYVKVVLAITAVGIAIGKPAGFTKVSALGIEEQRVRTILKLQDGDAESARLGHEFRVFVKISVYEAPSALRVPVSALFRQRDQWSVYVVERGRARAVPVGIGQRNARFAEVLTGLSQGAVVILHPSDRVGDGVRVTPLGGSS